MLSCSCEEGDWWYYDKPDVKPLATRRWRKCCSCKELIRPGDECMEFERWRRPEYGSIAERIYGDEEPLAAWYLCERCSGLFESLDGLGFCGLLGQNLINVCREYAEMQRSAGVFTGKMLVTKEQK